MRKLKVIGFYMQVDNALLSKLEKLSFLKVSANRREEIITQLSEIVSFVDNLSQLDTTGIDDNFAMSEMATPLREDIPTSSTDVSKDILSHAPQGVDDFFIVPKIIE